MAYTKCDQRKYINTLAYVELYIPEIEFYM